MKKIYIKIIFETLCLQIFFSIVSFLFMYYFSWLGDKFYIFNFLTAWLFLGALHSTFWQLGRKESKMIAIENNHLENDQPKIKQKMYTGALLGLFILLINIIISSVCYFSTNAGMFIFHRFLFASFLGFLPKENNEKYLFVSIIISFIIYLPCITAYISGAHNISLIEKFFPKIIYKQRSNKK